MSDPVVILGAGLAGLSAAYHQADDPLLLVEREDRVGGHARSDRRDGHVFDVTGHWLHLRDPGIRSMMGELFEPGEWPEIERRTYIRSHGALLHYPFQANLYGLPREVIDECLAGFLVAQRDAPTHLSPARGFRQFAEQRFGTGIARHFFEPYNQKLWGADAERLTADWVSRYIPMPEPEQVMAGALGVKQGGLGYNATFCYPRAGGIDRLPQALQAAIEARAEAQVRTGTAVEEVDPQGARVKLSGVPGWQAYSRLISTLPLPELIAKMPSAPPDVREAAASLKCVPWRWLDVATRTRPPADWHWIYVPEPQFPFFRVGIYSNGAAANAPEGCGSLYVELADRMNPPDIPAILRQLVELGAITAVDDVKFCVQRDIKHAYVLFDDAHGPCTALIMAWLEQVGIRSCGRYGGWTYHGMEDSMMSGRDAAAWAIAHRSRR